MARLEKEVCVKIQNIYTLKRAIDKQLSVIGKMAPVKYTTGHQRNHFLKSMDDEWQKEFRIFWQINESRNVPILPGTGKILPL